MQFILLLSYLSRSDPTSFRGTEFKTWMEQSNQLRILSQCVRASLLILAGCQISCFSLCPDYRT